MFFLPSETSQTYFSIFRLLLPIYHSKPAKNVYHFVVAFPQLCVATAYFSGLSSSESDHNNSIDQTIRKIHFQKGGTP